MSQIFKRTSSAAATGGDVGSSIGYTATGSSVRFPTEVSFGYKPLTSYDIVDVGYTPAKGVAGTCAATKSMVIPQPSNFNKTTNPAGTSRSRLWMTPDFAIFGYAVHTRIPAIAVMGSVFSTAVILNLTNA